MLQNLLALAVLLAVSGCATVAPMDQSSLDDMRASNVAVALSYPEKKINYDELVYKVLWNETRSATVSFKGVWDIDLDLSSQFAEQFRNKNLKAVSVAEVLDDAEYAHFSETMAAYHPARQSEDFTVDEQVRTALLDKGIEYLIAMRCVNLHVQAFSMGMDPVVQLIYRMNVVNLRTNKVQYSVASGLVARPDVEKSAREIEADGLAKLRAAVSESLRVSFEKDIVPKQMGLVATSK